MDLAEITVENQSDIIYSIRPHSNEDALVKYTDEDGQEYDICIEEENDDILVQVYDFPPNFSNEKILSEQSLYATVKLIESEKYFGHEDLFRVLTGTRTVWMTMKNKVPSYITRGQITSLVTYNNQIRTCIVCDETGHEGEDCHKLKRNRLKNIVGSHALMSDNTSVVAFNQEVTPLDESKKLREMKKKGKQGNIVGDNGFSLRG
ncbi:hypothetical protein WA026_016592 [Henosepilachna vigintioctopunctata]|uniref:CCHC-type domain-containing protein n=1 Tax=Henosepilachna vigintioctopunctata TaxID=420089 RepID=A0AAW1VGM3_9CUCU